MEKQFDFESLYKLYPRKMGKSDGLVVLQSTIKTEQDYLDFKSAVEAFSRHCTREGTEPQYIPFFSTFVGPRNNPRWRDWLEEDHGSVEVSSGVVDALNNIFQIDSGKDPA